jgi:hypothetical protein
MAMRGEERREEKRGERRREGKKGKKRSRERNGSMRERIGVLGKSRGYSYLISLIDVRIPRGSLQEGPHLVPIIFPSSFDQSHERCCVCGESVCG